MMVLASSWLKQSIITVLCVLGIPSYLSAPKPIAISLQGESSITIPANRAVLSLRVVAEGPKQDRVADHVRRTADEILGVLRPWARSEVLAQPWGENDTAAAAAAAAGMEDGLPSVVDFSVTTFRSFSYQKSRFLNRDTPQYESSMEIEAEFRRPFDNLGLLLAQVSKTPSVHVRSLQWKLDDATRSRLVVECRERAMVDALDKVRAYVRPLGMDKVRAIRVTEHFTPRRDVVTADLDGLQYLATQHDELDAPHQEEPLILEPQSLEIVAQIGGEFCAWKTGLEAWFRRGGV